MTSFWRIFSLELLSVVRSKTLAMLLVASVAWMFAAPFVFRGDGTSEGARELVVHYSLGGVVALLVVALTMSAAGAIAGERAGRRLQLTMVRPVRYCVIALGKIAAYLATAAIVLAVAGAIALVRDGASRPCRHVHRPVMPSPREEAEAIYAEYMRDPETPEAVRRAKKSVVIRMLAQRAIDNYQTIPTNDCARWTFRGVDSGSVDAPSVRFRFTNMFEMRDDLRGELAFGGWRASVSNITQAVLEVPLAHSETDAAVTNELVFANAGRRSVMVRPRRDLEFLTPADAFGWNLLRALVEGLALISLAVSFAIFLSAGLGRPTALFTVLVVLLLSEMTPSVIEQYPDELETNRVDAIGLALTRFAAEVTHPLSSLQPLADLSTDTCVEPRDVARVAAFDLVLLPVLFSLLAAFVMPRKQESGE